MTEAKGTSWVLFDGNADLTELDSTAAGREGGGGVGSFCENRLRRAGWDSSAEDGRADVEA